MSTIAIIPIPGIPQVKPNDDLPSLLLDAIDRAFGFGDNFLANDENVAALEPDLGAVDSVEEQRGKIIVGFDLRNTGNGDDGNGAHRNT